MSLLCSLYVAKIALEQAKKCLQVHPVNLPIIESRESQRSVADTETAEMDSEEPAPQAMPGTSGLSQERPDNLSQMIRSPSVKFRGFHEKVKKNKNTASKTAFDDGTQDVRNIQQNAFKNKYKKIPNMRGPTDATQSAPGLGSKQMGDEADQRDDRRKYRNGSNVKGWMSTGSNPTLASNHITDNGIYSSKGKQQATKKVFGQKSYKSTDSWHHSEMGIEQQYKNFRKSSHRTAFKQERGRSLRSKTKNKGCQTNGIPNSTASSFPKMNVSTTRSRHCQSKFRCKRKYRKKDKLATPQETNSKVASVGKC